MSPANDIPATSSFSLDTAARQLIEFADVHTEWFMSQDGRAPLEVNRSEFDFSAAHGRLIFSCWTQQGSRTWRVSDWIRSDDKLVLHASRRMGAETTTIELVPRASAKALITNIAAARQMRCEQLAELVAEGLGGRVLGVDEDYFVNRGGIEESSAQSESNQLHPEPYSQHPSAKGVDAIDSLNRGEIKQSREQSESNRLHPIAEGLGDRVLGVEANYFVNRGGIEESPVQSESNRLHPEPYPQHPSAKGVEAIDLLNKAEIKRSREQPEASRLHPTPYPQHPSIKIERATLSPGMRRDQPGRYARIILRLPHERVAVTSIVAQSDPRNVDSLFSSALLWFARLQSSARRPPINRLLIAVEKNILEAARQRLVLLRDSLRQSIELLLIDDDWREIESTPRWERKYLWRKKLPRFPPVIEAVATDRGNQIVAIAPEAIDVVASRHGQTLRFHGLPFARIRRVMERDYVWFGIEGSPRRALGEYQRPEFAKLLDDLQTYRQENCRDRRHWFYRAAGEAWLESILRRDITRLDPGLIIAPLHAQFRTSPGGPAGPRPVDLLALRHDGRLVVIELKVNEDREHVFQGVDYWRRVEAHRRRGHLSAAKLFGDREISDESPMVYLCAPTLRFHPSFATLARTIAPDIEIYRFDINEDWRTGVRVVRRERVNS